tara:strand:- start:300 stop:527 length:228 start_codon:yes stop_codon:yes gene_type:complete
MIWIITASMLYFNTPNLVNTDYTLIKFNNVEECHEYIFYNKVELVLSLFEKHGTLNNQSMKSFEFYCKSIELEEV